MVLALLRGYSGALRIERVCVLVSDSLVLQGGEQAFAQSEQGVWRLDLLVLQWDRMVTYGVKGATRYGHCGGFIERTRQIVLFTGYDGVSLSDEVDSINVVDWRWLQPKVTGEAPLPRGFATCCVNDTSIVMYGGRNSRLVI